MTSCKSETVVTNISSLISPAWLSTLILVLYFSGRAFLRIHIPPLKPSTAVQHLLLSIKEEITVFDAHPRELGTFNSQLLLLKFRSLVLSRELRQAEDALLWSDMHTWFRCISRLKKVWINTRDHQRTVDGFRKRMKYLQDAISAMEEERSRAEVEIAQHRESLPALNMTEWSYRDLATV
ncbi:hypothetical protein IW261DRAFT_1588791 [Armillaria novae-zelandiae]|uniref:Uncharacterized protein n=1 Tax=Armillaria novae-zelandiae TaxID=153914 RepID=A0AA39TH21_9AGAR|nr:hypothetical protein IW261DRAFT_1588791 [Armillaria novae-zelandiae]